MNPNALVASTAVLRSALDNLNGSRNRFGRRVFAAHDFEQRHDVGRHEEVQADDFIGALRHRGHFVDVERRGIRSEDSLGLYDPVEFGEDFFLDIHVLKDGFDDDVGVGQLAVVVGKLHRLAKLPRFFLRHAALLDLIHEHAHDGLFGLLDAASLESITCTGMPACAKVIAMPVPIVPEPMTPAFLISRGLASGKSRNLRKLALGKEHVTQRCRRGRARELFEQPAFACEAELEGQFHRGFDCIDQLVRGESAVVFGRHQLVRLGHDERRSFIDEALAQPRLAMRNAMLAAFAREVDRDIEEISLDDLIDDALFLGLVHLDVATLEHHVERVLRANQTRKTLRAAGTGQQPDLDLGQTDFRIGQRNAVIAGKREFETAAERHLFDRCDEGFLALLDRGDHVANRLGLRRRFGAEVVDVGAAENCPLAPMNTTAVILVSADAASTIGTSSPESAYESELTGG